MFAYLENLCLPIRDIIEVLKIKKKLKVSIYIDDKENKLKHNYNIIFELNILGENLNFEKWSIFIIIFLKYDNARSNQLNVMEDYTICK